MDNDHDAAAALGEILARDGYLVETCLDGSHACTTARALLPDAIISEVQLAELGGLGVLYLLRTDPATRAIPVHFYTTAPAVEMAPWQEALQERGATVLYRPADLVRVLDWVAALPSRDR